MTLVEAFGLGALQGATEFLPVSSSGHLALAQALLPPDREAGGSVLLFDLIVHLGTLLAVVAVLRARIAGLVRGAWSLLPGRRDVASDLERRWLGLIVLASVPTAVLGLALKGVVEHVHERPAWVGAALLVTAVLLVTSERMGSWQRGADDLGPVDALWMGLVQGLAVMPGISRSGSTVALGLYRGVDGGVAVEFSMLISIPAIVGANLLEMLDVGREALSAQAAPLVVGFATAFAVGVAALKALQWVVTRRRLTPFAVYCALLGAGVIWLGAA